MKKIGSVLLCVILTLSLFSFTAFAAPEDDVMHLPEDDGTGYPVTGIGDSYNGNDGVTKVTVPNNIVRLGGRAFFGCSNLNQIKLHNRIQKIGEQAFAGTAYYADADNWENGVLYIGDCLIQANPDAISDTYEIRNGTRLIADGAFRDCKKLSAIILPDTVEYVGAGVFTDTAFFNNPNNWENGALLLDYLLLAVDKEYTGVFDVPDGIRTIADGAFSRCSEMTDVTTPDSLKHIGCDAFWDCQKLMNVSLGKSVETLGRGPFRMCTELQTIAVHRGNAYFATADGILYDKQLTEVIRCPEKMTEKVVIPHSVRRISAYAFERCRALAYVEIPNGCVFIGHSAFSECDALKEVTLPESMEYIDKYAFAYCNSIESVFVPENVNYLGSYAFTCCMNLKEAEIGNSVTTIRDNLFASCEKLNKVTLGNNVEDIADSAFQKTKYISDMVNYPNGLLISSGKYLIKIAKGVVNCSIPSGVTLIADGAFEHLSAEGTICEIHVPSSVKRLNQDAFDALPNTVSIYYDGSIAAWDCDYMNVHTTGFQALVWAVATLACAFLALAFSLWGYNHYKTKQHRLEETEAEDAE